MSAEPWPSELRLRSAEKSLEIDFDNGARFRLPAEYLRVESPSAEVQGHGPGEKQLVAALKPYFQRHHIDADFAAIGSAPAERLVTSLAMMCPFAPREKQALLEAADFAARSKLLIALLEMAAMGGNDVGPARH